MKLNKQHSTIGVYIQIHFKMFNTKALLCRTKYALKTKYSYFVHVILLMLNIHNPCDKLRLIQIALNMRMNKKTVNMNNLHVYIMY